MKITVCIAEDMMDLSTRKYRVVRQLENGKFEVQGMTEMRTAFVGSPYIAYGKPRVISPEKMFNVHEEEVPDVET